MCSHDDTRVSKHSPWCDGASAVEVRGGVTLGATATALHAIPQSDSCICTNRFLFLCHYESYRFDLTVTSIVDCDTLRDSNR